MQKATCVFFLFRIGFRAIPELHFSKTNLLSAVDQHKLMEAKSP